MVKTFAKLTASLIMICTALTPCAVMAQNAPVQAGIKTASVIRPAARVVTDQIENGLDEPFSESFLKQIRTGSKYLYYQGSVGDAGKSLSEVVKIYCEMPGSILYYDVADESGTYLEITDDCWPSLKSAVAKADQAWQGYRDYVADACSSLDLSASDASIVEQINDFICDHFSYRVTNSGMPSFLAMGQGQCWHYAKLFADMCCSVGIPASKVQTTDHAWDIVTVDGIQYTWDVTYNDTCGNQHLYMWLDPVRVSESSGQSQAQPAGWVQEGAYWYYQKSNGQYASSQWLKIHGTWYYFDHAGIMCTSRWIQDGSDWYYVKKDGSMAVSMWIGDCYVDASGKWAA